VPSASPTTVPSSDSFTAMTQAPLVVDAEPTTVASTADRGLPLPALATAGLLGLLAVAGGVLVWRRRIAAHGDE
jgi:hypothetical protein